MMTNKLMRWLAAGAAAAALGACGTTAPPAAAVRAAAPADLASQAEQAVAAGQMDKAIDAWKRAALAAPADKAPWLKIAQSQYDGEQYADAIASAREALLRDPGDAQANAIIATGALKLSVRAVGELGRQKKLAAATRTEVQRLSRQLRDNLGEAQATVVAPAAIRRPEPCDELDRALKKNCPKA